MSNEMKRFIEVSSFYLVFLPGTVYSFLAVLNLDPPSHFLLVLSPIHYEKKPNFRWIPFGSPVASDPGAMGAGVGKKRGCAFERYELYKN